MITLQNKKHADMATIEVNRLLDQRRWWAQISDPQDAWLVVPAKFIIAVSKANDQWMPSNWSRLFMDPEDNVFFALDSDTDRDDFLRLHYPAPAWESPDAMKRELDLRCPQYEFRDKDNWLRAEPKFPHYTWMAEMNKAASEKRNFALRLST